MARRGASNSEGTQGMKLFARLYAGLAFLLMGFSKIGTPDVFLKSIHTYEILPTEPPFWLNIAAVGLPWMEVLAGMAILSGILRRGAATVAGLFLALFTLAIVWRSFSVMDTEGIAFFDVAFDCGCGSGVVVIWQKLIQNILLLFATLLCTKTWTASTSAPQITRP